MSNLSKLLSVFVVMGVLALFGMKVVDNHKVPDIHNLSGVVEYMMKTAPNRQVSKGSGVFIGPQHVLTAAHVLQFQVEDERFNARVRLQDGDIYHITKIVKSKDYDLAIAELDRPYRTAVKFPEFTCKPTEQGQVLNAVGSPMALEYIDVEIRAVGGSQMKLYASYQNPSQNGPSVPLPKTKKAEEPAPSMAPKKEAKKNKKYKVVPPDELPKGDPKDNAKIKNPKQQTNITGGVYFQGPALPGQSGSPVYDQYKDIRGVITTTMVDDNLRSYSGIGMYVDSPFLCEFVSKAKATF
jgi:hypothetical protein